MSRVWKFLLSFLLFVTVCYVGLVWFVDREVTQEIDRTVADTPGMELAYDDVSVSLSDHTVTLDKVEMALPDGQHFVADTVAISRFDQLNTIPHFVTAKATGVVMETTFANFGSWAAPLTAMGIETVTGDVDLNYDYDTENKELTLDSLAITSADLGDIAISGTIKNLDLAELRVEKLLGLGVSMADLQFTNRSLMDSMLDSAARNMGVSKDTARAQIGAELTVMADYAGKDGNTVAEDALRGIKRFVDEPGTLKLSVRPAEPVPLLYFFMGRDFYDNLRLLNVKVITNSSDEI
ncbi:hypothetical protein OAN24_03680 [Pseudodesulfovibrio sp.]|nr:hypothetical protein [Pseudodesulfovibrio sp.]